MTIPFTLLKILCGTVLVGSVSSIVGCFLLLQKKSLLGDTLAHSTLPGIACTFLITLKKNILYLLVGATITSLISSICIEYISQKTTLKKDAVLGTMLSFMFGLGIMVLSIIQKYPVAQQAGINTFLLGNASTLLLTDVYIITLLSCIVYSMLYLFWKEFLIVTFDQNHAQNIQMPVQYIKAVFTIVTVLTILIGLQTVGIVLMSALLIAPAAAAQQWTKNIRSMILLSSIFSIFATTTGTVISFYVPQTPTGPVIVIIITSIAFASILYKTCADYRIGGAS